MSGRIVTYDRSVPCPYCNERCECDLVDVGFGEANGIQCGPYHCDECGASQIGPEMAKIKDTLTEFERKCGWYAPGKPVSPHANTIDGTLVDHKTARKLYEMGLLDEKPSNDLDSRTSEEPKK
jgi:hypothetical protein